MMLALLVLGCVLVGAAGAQAAGPFPNEQAYACTNLNDSNGRNLRAEFIFDPGLCGRIAKDQFAQEPLFSYYQAAGFDANFLVWAPIIQRNDVGGRKWAGCRTDHGPGTVCPGGLSNVGFRYPVGADFNGPATVKNWNDGFIGVVCGNFSQTGERNGPTPTITGTKYEDLNGNGSRDAGEPGLGGVLITLMRNGADVATTTTAADGTYTFALDANNPAVRPGTYTLREAVPTGFHQTAAPGPIAVDYAIGAQTFAGNDFGNAKAQPKISTVPSGPVPVGANISDSATLSGGASPSGAVTFTLYGPGDTQCTNPIASATGVLTGATALSGDLVAGPPGVYNWVASYPGDGSNYGVVSPCGSETVEVDAPITAVGTTVAPIEGGPFTATIATFSDPQANASATEYTATIDWGDATGTSPGAINQPGGPGTPFTVIASHTYAEEGTYTAKVTITDKDTPLNSATANSTANVGDAALSASGVAPTSPQGFNGTVANFTDANAGATTADFSATIDWGDGSNSTGTVTGSGGSFSVAGNHTYTGTGYFTVTVKIIDDGGSTATTTSTILIYGTVNGGNFVIGDNNAANRTQVTFWGAQWWKLNSLSGGPAPASFKGFEDSPATTSCGTNWTTDPGNSTPPPAGPLPAYMLVIVSSNITKSGSTIAGDTAHQVVVKTTAGYAPNPGHPGAGTVVAQIC